MRSDQRQDETIQSQTVGLRELAEQRGLLVLTPKTKRPAGEPGREPVVYPDVERERGDGTGPPGS